MKIPKKIFQMEIAVAVLLIALLWWGAAFKISRLEAQAKAELSQKNKTRLEDAITVYRGDNQGRCPENLEELLKEHLERIPDSFDKRGVKSSAVKSGAYAKVYDGGGGWVYVNDPNDDKYCTVHQNIF